MRWARSTRLADRLSAGEQRDDDPGQSPANEHDPCVCRARTVEEGGRTDDRPGGADREELTDFAPDAGQPLRAGAQTGQWVAEEHQQYAHQCDTGCADLGLQAEDGIGDRQNAGRDGA